MVRDTREGIVLLGERFLDSNLDFIYDKCN
jgi:hypothetical protein